MMRTRANSSSTGVGDSRMSPEPWMVSRHLLVAQAVSAALASVGLVVHAIPWEAAGENLRLSDDGDDGPAQDLLFVLDDVSSPAAVETINQLARDVDARVVVVTSHPPDMWWGGLLESEAVEVVGTAYSVKRVADLVRRSVAGETLMEAELRASLREEWARAVESRGRLVDLMAKLSPKELRVLELLTSGYQVSEIGQLLGVTSSTVRSHVKSLRGKLGVPSQLAAVSMLVRLRDLGMPGPWVPRPRPPNG